MRRSITTVVALVALASLAAACGSDDDEASATVATAPTTTVPVATTVAATTPPTAPATTAPVTEPPTTAPATTEPATTAPPEPELLDPMKKLRPGVTYRTDTAAIGVPIELVANDGARWAVNLPGYFGVSTQASGDELMVGVTDLATARLFTDPLADLNSMFPDNAKLFAATVEMPDDYLAAFAALPGVTAGPVTASTFAGLPSRSMTYSVADPGGGSACYSTKPDQRCLLTLFQASGLSVVYLPGDSGTFHEVELDGRPVLFEVSDRAGAAELAATMTIAG